MKARQADALGALFVTQMKIVTVQALGRIVLENDSALAALAMSAAIVMQIDPVQVQHIEEQSTGFGLDRTKILDLYSAFL